jgi:hypothetical protein
MTREEVSTYTAAIYIAGEVAEARRVCRGFCMKGLCVTVEPVEFIYTGGAETGVRVGLINYPRFPATPAEILDTAEHLAVSLINQLYQHSATIVATDKTVWLSRRETNTDLKPDSVGMKRVSAE